MIKLILNALTADLQQQISEMLDSAHKENEELKERIKSLELALLDHAKAISVLATIQGNTLKEVKTLVTDKEKSAARRTVIRRSDDDDIIN
jgi:hypothetical protein